MRKFLRTWMIALALTGIASPAIALSGSDYVGRWSGQTDWRGIEGFDNGSAWWEFHSDGTFVDNAGETGTWSVGSDGYISFTYAGGGQSQYSGTIVGPTLLGTMTNGSANGVFALHR